MVQVAQEDMWFINECPPDCKVQLDNEGRIDMVFFNAKDRYDLPRCLYHLESFSHPIGLRINRLKSHSIQPLLQSRPNIDRLILHGGSIKAIPSEIGDIKSLFAVILEHLPLCHLCPELGDLPYLKTLSCKDTLLADLPPTLHRLKNMESLNLEDNLFTEVPAVVSAFKNLESLTLSNNIIKEIGRVLIPLSNLWQLDLSDNPLNVFNQYEIPRSLQVLYLNGMGLTEIPRAILSLKKLTELGVAENKICQLPFWLMRFRYLTELNISSNRIGRIPNWILFLKSLNLLYIDQNPFPRLTRQILSEFYRVNGESFITRGNLKTFIANQTDRLMNTVIGGLKANRPPEPMVLKNAQFLGQCAKILPFIEAIPTEEAKKFIVEIKQNLMISKSRSIFL
jgi:Leucine-rich repeat (LRR) protein